MPPGEAIDMSAVGCAVGREDSGMAFCTRCVGQLVPDAPFCPHCGRPTSSGPMTPVAMAQPSSTPQPMAKHTSTFFGGLFTAMGAALGCLFLLLLLFAGCVAVLTHPS